MRLFKRIKTIYLVRRSRVFFVRRTCPASHVFMADSGLFDISVHPSQARIAEFRIKASHAQRNGGRTKDRRLLTVSLLYTTAPLSRLLRRLLLFFLFLRRSYEC